MNTVRTGSSVVVMVKRKTPEVITVIQMPHSPTLLMPRFVHLWATSGRSG